MSRILVSAGSPALAARLSDILLEAGRDHSVLTIPPVDTDAEPGSLWDSDGAGPPQVLVLDCVPGAASALALTERLAVDCPAVSVVLVTEGGAALALAAIRAGATDLLHPEAEAAEVVRVLTRAAELAQVRTVQLAGPPVVGASPLSQGQVISVVSPKGGVGKTTVATNLAVGLARSAPQATVLVDLDLQFGDVASGLNLDPEYFLPSAVHGPASTDTLVLKTFLTLHETGLYALCAPESPVEADQVTPEDVRRLLRALAAEFRYVVVDTAPGLSDHTLAAMDETTDLVLLTSMDVPGLRGLRKEIDTLRSLELLNRPHQVVINFAAAATGLSTADIEATIGARVDLTLPRSKAAPASVNLGVPLLQSGGRDPMTKQLLSLVERYTSGGAPAQPVVKAGRTKKPDPVPRRAASGWFRRPRAVAS